MTLERRKIHVNVCETVECLAGFLNYNDGKLEEAEDFKYVFFSLFVVANRNRSALVRDLLCNNSQFVGQLYVNKSLALRARDFIFFTTDLQTVNYYTKFTDRADFFLKLNMATTPWRN